MGGGTYQHQYFHISPPLDPPVFDQGWSNSWPVDKPAYTQNRQDCGGAIPTYGLMQDMQAYQGLSVARPLDSMYQTTFPCSTQLASPGYEGCFQYASDEDPTLGDVDATHSLRMGRISMHASLDWGPDDTTRDPTVSSTFPRRISRTPTVVQNEEQSASRYQPQELEKRSAAASSYSCNICSKVYAQPQGVRRHHREVHQVNICTYCDFKWGRPYQFRKHLKKKHPNVDPDDVRRVLGGLTGSHRKATTIPKYSPQQHVSPPSPEHDRRDRAESRLCARAPLPSAMAPVSPLFDASAYACASAAISSTEEHAQRANDLEIAYQNQQIWYQNNGQSVCQGASTTASCHPYDPLADTATAQLSWNSWLTV